MSAEVGVPVAELLSLDALANTKVLAGAAGLTRLVTNVNVMEVPDIIPWVKERTIVITTGYAIRDNVEAQEQLIPQLHHRGASALAIKPERYLGSLPAHMYKAADDLAFPLLALPRDANFSDLMSAILRRIVTKQGAILSQVPRIHEQLMKFVLKGVDLTGIASGLAELLDASVSLVDALAFNYAVAVRSDDADSREAIVRFLEARSTQNLAELGELRIGVEATHKQVELGGSFGDYVEVPIVVNNKCYGYVHAVRLERVFNPWDVMALEQAASIVALHVLHNHGIAQVERRYQSEFLQQLLHSDGMRDDEFVRRGRFFGWDLEKKHVVLMLDLPVGESVVAAMTRSTDYPGHTDVDRNVARLSRWAERMGGKCRIVPTIDGVFVLLQLAGDEPSDFVQSMAESLAEELQPRKVAIGIGGAYPRPAGLRKSYIEAKLALQASKELGGNGCIRHFEQLGILSLMLRQASIAEQKEYAQSILEPLLLHDKKTGCNTLFHTLDTYLTLGGNAREAAKALFIHYNTVLYRLEKIHSLIKLDPRDPDHRMTLQVAVRLLKLIGSLDGYGVSSP